MSRKPADSVIVITGASSGIGWATAEAFAKRRATLVLAARREHALNKLARHCQSLGARVLAVPTDVTDESAVEHLAQEAIENFGRIDVWVNNAAVSLFARFEEAPSDVYRKVVETNLFGYIHGARSAIRCFREQGSGVLINVASVVSSAPQPYTSAYCATKAAIRSLSDCLRMELHLDRPHDIHVCTLMPGSIDTPLFQQAANYTGRAVKPLDPVNPPEAVAEAVVRLAKHPCREKLVGRAAGLAWFQSVAMPGLYERIAAGHIDRNHLQDKPADPSPGNLFEPMPQHTGASGGWRPETGLSWKQTMLAGLALAAGAWVWWTARQPAAKQPIFGGPNGRSLTGRAGFPASAPESLQLK